MFRLIRASPGPATPSEVAGRTGANATTDITGFGLPGHLAEMAEMAEGSASDARLRFLELPWPPGTDRPFPTPVRGDRQR